MKKLIAVLVAMVVATMSAQASYLGNGDQMDGTSFSYSQGLAGDRAFLSASAGSFVNSVDQVLAWYEGEGESFTANFLIVGTIGGPLNTEGFNMGGFGPGFSFSERINSTFSELPSGEFKLFNGGQITWAINGAEWDGGVKSFYSKWDDVWGVPHYNWSGRADGHFLPEPTTLMVVSVGGLLLFRRRCRVGK